MESMLQNFPIHDAGIPSHNTTRAILNSLDSALKRNQAVYVHCWGGGGRTGTVVGCFFARHGIAVEQAALDKFKELGRNDPTKGQPSPENDDHRELALSWKVDE